MAEVWSANTDERIKSLSERIQDAMVRHHIPGVAVGLLHGEREYTAGFGVTNVLHPLPVDADTLFQIGSITKTFTATLAMQLVERGTLALDVPVRTYLPDLRLADEGVAAGVTMRHLLTHTAGWEGDFFEDTGDGDDALARMVARMADLPQVVPLGEVHAYNNAGFFLAGRVIEMLVGTPFETAMYDMLLKPLGLQCSFFFAKEVITDRVAAGHQVRDGGPHVLREWALQRAGSPVGGLITTVDDILRYARFQMGDGAAADGTRLLKPASLAAMQEPQVRVTDNRWCGLAWGLGDGTGVRTVSHGGGSNGQISLLLMVPTRQFAIVVLTNADKG
jgi:CubicO group peptidase (beta-lactamase class C family)